MKRTRILLVAATLLMTPAALSVAHAESWWWSAGGAARHRMEVEISGDSHVQQLGLSGGTPYSRSASGVGSTDAFGNRTYDDGFVNIDPGTESDGLGLTWYWGYDKDDQYHAAGDTLAFTRSGGSRLSRHVAMDAGVDADDDVSGAGFAISGGRDLIESGTVKLGVAAGLQSLWNMESGFQGTTYKESLSVREYSVVDTYALEGVIPPAAPYSGTYDGPGPLIGNIPSSRSESVTKNRTYEAWNYVDIDTAASLQELWLGPRVEWQPAKRLSMFVEPFVSLNLVDVDIDRREQFLVAGASAGEWSDNKSEDDWLFGAGVRVGARVQFGGPWFVDASISRDWVEAMNVAVGPNTISLDVSGCGAMLALGSTF